MIQAFSDFTNSARRLGTWGSLLFLATAVLLFASVMRTPPPRASGYQCRSRTSTSLRRLA